MINIVMELKLLVSIFVRLGSKVGVLAVWRLGNNEEVATSKEFGSNKHGSIAGELF